jgi:GAF domain-containing protein
VGARLPLANFSPARYLLANPGSSFLIGDVERDPRLDPPTLAFFRQLGAKALALMPLTVGGQWFGLLVISWSAPRRFGDRDVQRYQSFADQAAVAANNLMLFEQTQRRANRERLINDITRKIQGTTQVDSALQTAIQELGQALNARRASVALAVETPAAPGNGQASSDRATPVGS